MASMLKNLNEKNIFLLDAIGAMLSAVFTGVILPNYSDLIGLRKELLYGLAFLPVVYAIYSFSCFQFVKTIKPMMIIYIISANLLYCAISLSLILFCKDLTSIGNYLLLLEIFVVIVVVKIELNVLKKILLVKN